ncbi:L-isoaspartate(D-aspartate) O-methyltransferase [Micractinium conductrix]|uniref:protein-L-isoaspartate(D-aspartate) O-methyltransferase n=1 Tax=Micractinium conductrix TaxID=554055 RepID=A0A2P6UZB5_9CHLO|nr:L-isoaspartate(D-aspartate) O-methyltransferase [Micractinium conductrix]|eukprot:PSC67192.1 L-isoaspartate(D-aspartate) O-methyltransferase [Micractinium conductrix]
MGGPSVARGPGAIDRAAAATAAAAAAAAAVRRCWMQPLATPAPAASPALPRRITWAAMHSQDWLVDHLRAEGVVKSREVESVLRRVDRAHYVDRGIPHAYAYQDSPLLIGFHETITAPHMHATCLELLRDHLKPGARVLDVGSGSGYLSAALGLMVGETGKVVGIEKHPELAALLRAGNVLGDVLEREEGFDAIHVGAAASSLPDILVRKLNPGGRMVIPVGPQWEYQVMQVVDKDREGKVKKHNVMHVREVGCPKNHVKYYSNRKGTHAELELVHFKNEKQKGRKSLPLAAGPTQAVVLLEQAVAFMAGWFPQGTVCTLFCGSTGLPYKEAYVSTVAAKQLSQYGHKCTARSFRQFFSTAWRDFLSFPTTQLMGMTANQLDVVAASMMLNSPEAWTISYDDSIAERGMRTILHLWDKFQAFLFSQHLDKISEQPWDPLTATMADLKLGCEATICQPEWQRAMCSRM